MLKTITSRFLILTVMLLPLSGNIFADDHAHVVPHADYQMGWEAFIMADTSATGEQNHDIYILESSKVYYQQVPLRMYDSFELHGAEYDESAGGFPATIQQIPGADGSNQFDNWPASNILLYGTGGKKTVIFNLLFNGMMADGSGATFGVIAEYGEDNVVIVDHVTSVHNQVITYFNFGKRSDWTITNCKAVQYTCYAGGMYFGGFFWGGGSWGGTLSSFYSANNTIEGAHANPYVIWTGPGVGTAGAGNTYITHNTFVNTIDQIKFVRDANNVQFENNLIVNSMSQGQTRNASNTSIAQNGLTSYGKMTTKSQGECSDSTMLADGTCWDNNNRNISYKNNAWMDTPELLAHFAFGGEDGWCWNLVAADGSDSVDASGNVVSLCDTMVAVADQNKWLDDSTEAQFANGISESNNIKVDDLGLNLNPVYIETQILRSLDWLDNAGHQTYTTHNWMHQADNDPLTVQWPLPMDFTYSMSSAAYTHAMGGLPVGDLNAFPGKKDEWIASGLGTDKSIITPNKFTLAQNFPNPFNPTTSISFALDRNAEVNLSIYNMLGQKVRTLAEGSKNAGTHTLQWNGLDDAGQNVSTGIYLYRLTSGSKSITKKMAFMK